MKGLSKRDVFHAWRAFWMGKKDQKVQHASPPGTQD